MSLSPPTLTALIDVFAFVVCPGLAAILIAVVPAGAFARRCRARECRHG